ncbi:MAG: MFS transporter [Thermoguttaceae bacterium]|nr:MFS transporter [Thermoguttaceae bacterium]
MSVGWEIYIPLSVVMFLEYAVWGAWAPVLAARLLGPLKMSGKQTGWIYATLPIACIVSPLVAGQLADKYFNVEWILAAAHFLGAILMFLAIKRTSFASLFLVMLGYSLCYAATLPLVNSALFNYVKDGDTQAKVFIWAPVAWALVGYFLSGWRMLRKGEGDGSDCLVLAGVLSLVTAACCLLLPPSEPKATGEIPILKTFGMLQQFDFLVFIVISLVVSGMMQFYFLGSARYMMDRQISGKAVPASMAMAQAAQAIATLFALGPVLGNFGFKWTLTMGAGCWLLLYLVYVSLAPRALIVVSQVLHGLAYVMFMIVGQVYADKVAPADIRSSIQALIFAATTGVGLFLGTQMAGIAMDKFKEGEKFQWTKIWAVPLIVVLAGTIALATVFQGTVPK